MDIAAHPEAVWRLETAPRAAVFVDVADYLAAAKSAMMKAKRSIHLLNWAFEPRTRFKPESDGAGPADDEIGHFLIRLATENENLDVRILCWKSALPVAATQGFFPLQDRRWFTGTAVKFVLDGKLPFGACHHQKMIIIDDALAFCGGADIGPDRWDTSAHLDDDPRRLKGGRHKGGYNSRHEVMCLMDGPPAAALAGLFRARWRRATGEAMAKPASVAPAWPEAIAPDLTEIRVGVSRTVARWRTDEGAQETLALSLASIAEARRCIYLENQYFTSPVVARALAERLQEPDGPEVVLVSTQRSPSWFDHMTMDRTRSNFIKTLKAADRYRRFQIYCPVTTLGRIIIVHAKVAIIDDDVLRVGSANMNNRSTGFDTECDIAFFAGDSQTNRAAIDGLRVRLVAHWLGCATEAVRIAIDKEGRVGAAIEALRGSGHARLRPIPVAHLGAASAAIAALHIGDPLGPTDSFQPWKRPRLLAAVESRDNVSLP
jgi:phosphatidylserine/phosphatidylglycerophosphate/cardiolipin synthase-like enzyme